MTRESCIGTEGMILESSWSRFKEIWGQTFEQPCNFATDCFAMYKYV